MNDPNPQFSKTHLTTLNLSNFKTIAVVGLKIIASRLLFFPNFTKIYHAVQKLLLGDTHTNL
jgi:surface protein